MEGCTTDDLVIKRFVVCTVPPKDLMPVSLKKDGIEHIGRTMTLSPAGAVGFEFPLRR